MLQNFTRARAMSISLIAGLSFAAPQAAHAGFLEELFGGAAVQQAPQAAAPTYQAPAPAPSYRKSYGATSEYTHGNTHASTYEPARPARPKKKVAARAPVDEKPVLQKPTDLMHDATLQRGDAVMMKSGIQVYSGPEASVHNPRQFQALDRARHLKPSERTKLAAADISRNDPLLHDSETPDSIASGRSASVGTPISKGIRITDAHGRSIRYVGP